VRERRIGRTNLAKLPGFVARRREIVDRVNQAMTDQARAVRLVTGRDQDQPSWWFMVLRLEQGALRVGKDEFVKAVVAEGMPATAGYPS
jgi:perosamine synthetase